MFQRGLLSSSSCLNKPKGPVQRKHTGIKIQNISRLTRTEQAPSNVCSFMRWWARSDKHFALLFVCVWKSFLRAFSLSLLFFFFNLSIFLKKSLLPLSLRYLFKATSCFYKVNPLLQRSDQIRLNAAHRPSLRTAARPHRGASALGAVGGWLFGFFFPFSRVLRGSPLRYLPTIRVMPRTASPGFHI